jgi:DNA-binding transcriptional LysR family regulator
MELRHLRYFVAVATELNFRRAAARLRVAQPAISRQVRDLEDELGFPLLERRAKSVHLTAAGRVFLNEAQAVLQRTTDAVNAARAVATGKQGKLHVGYAPSLTVEILPQALRTFQEQMPGVRVMLHDLSTQEMLDALRHDCLDLALLVRPPKPALRGLRFEELRRYPLCVALATSHPLARRRQVSLPAVAEERLIAYSRAGYPEYHDQLAALLGKPQIAEEHDSATSLIAAVEAGRGIAIVPQCFACLAGARLKVRPLTPAPPALVVGAICRDGKPTPVAEAFLNAARGGHP